MPSIDLSLFNRAGVLPSLSGGDLYYIPKFDPVRAGGRLRSTMDSVIHREMGYNATMRVRCSTGASFPPRLNHPLRPLNDADDT